MRLQPKYPRANGPITFKPQGFAQRAQQPLTYNLTIEIFISDDFILFSVCFRFRLYRCIVLPVSVSVEALANLKILSVQFPIRFAV